jgi:hypothetical protein
MFTTSNHTLDTLSGSHRRKRNNSFGNFYGDITYTIRRAQTLPVIRLDAHTVLSFTLNETVNHFHSIVVQQGRPEASSQEVIDEPFTRTTVRAPAPLDKLAILDQFWIVRRGSVPGGHEPAWIPPGRILVQVGILLDGQGRDRNQALRNDYPAWTADITRGVSDGSDALIQPPRLFEACFGERHLLEGIYVVVAWRIGGDLSLERRQLIGIAK